MQFRGYDSSITSCVSTLNIYVANGTPKSRISGLKISTFFPAASLRDEA